MRRGRGDAAHPSVCHAPLKRSIQYSPDLGFHRKRGGSCFSTAPYPFRNLREPLRRVIAAFGPKRAFWGSDITRVPASCSYRQTVTHVTEELDFLSANDLEWIMERGLAECL